MRSYPPQAFAGDVPFNTNYPPQSDSKVGSTPPPVEDFVYLLEDDAGFYELEDTSGLYELENGP